jgi:phosphoglycerate dehydrogenase-like enzyme
MNTEKLVFVAGRDLYTSDELAEYFADLSVSVRMSTEADPPTRWEEAADATYLVIARAAITERVLDQLPQLEAIVKFGRGLERIDLQAATEHRVLVAYTPHAVQGMAEAALLLMLALSKNLFRHVSAVKEGTYLAQASRPAKDQEQFHHLPLGSELRGKTLGVVGFGAIGSRLASMAHHIGMQILIHTRTPDPAEAANCDGMLTSLDELLERSDYVSLNLTPLPGGRPLLDESRFAQMKDDAVLINTARGSLVDERALVAALASGKLAGAGLDVVADEPLQPDNPLLEMENVIVTPHSLGVTGESMNKIKEATRRALELLLVGRLPPYVANRDVTEGRARL